MLINDAQRLIKATTQENSEQYSRGQSRGAEINTAVSGRTKAELSITIETVIERANMQLAYQRVVGNKGAAGGDNLSVHELKPWLKKHWLSTKSALMTNSYLSRAIRKIDIPKPDGGVRTLGIPTVIDRLIQQAIAQKLSSLVEPTFSTSSYGFRASRNAWQAVRQAQTYITNGKRWGVDMDLEKFFDKVDHDILMSRLARVIKDTRLLKLIRRYLEAPMWDGKEQIKRTQGMPRCLKVVHYHLCCPTSCWTSWTKSWSDADISSVAMQMTAISTSAVAKRGVHLLHDISNYLTKTLKLTLNKKKSAVARP